MKLKHYTIIYILCMLFSSVYQFLRLCGLVTHNIVVQGFIAIAILLLTVVYFILLLKSKSRK